VMPLTLIAETLVPSFIYESGKAVNAMDPITICIDRLTRRCRSHGTRIEEKPFKIVSFSALNAKTPSELGMDSANSITDTEVLLVNVTGRRMRTAHLYYGSHAA